MTVLYYLVLIAVILLTVVGIHELGHYCLARYFGVKATRVVIGIGTPFYIYQLSSGLELALAPLPIGGYVKLLDEREAKLTESQKRHSFTVQPIINRILILLAGPMMNFMLAIVLFIGLFSFGLKAYQPVLPEIAPNSIMAKAGLKKGDQIIAIDGWPTLTWSQVMMVIISHGGQSLPLSVKVKQVDKAQPQILLMDVSNWTLSAPTSHPLTDLGLVMPKTLSPTKIQLPFLQAVQMALMMTGEYIALNSLVVAKIIMGKISLLALAGPVSFLSSAKTLMLLGIDKFFFMVALLSIAVGVANLLPLPTLDGGHILFLLIEKWRGHPLSIEVQVLMYRIMLAFFFIIFMQLLANDFHRMAAVKKPQAAAAMALKKA